MINCKERAREREWRDRAMGWEKQKQHKHALVHRAPPRAVVVYTVKVGVLARLPSIQTFWNNNHNANMKFNGKFCTTDTNYVSKIGRKKKLWKKNFEIRE